MYKLTAGQTGYIQHPFALYFIYASNEKETEIAPYLGKCPANDSCREYYNVFACSIRLKTKIRVYLLCVQGLFLRLYLMCTGFKIEYGLQHVRMNCNIEADGRKMFLLVLMGH